MTKSEWQKIYEVLDKIHSDFIDSYSDYINGSNKKIKSTGERNAASSISLARNFIQRNPDVVDLFINSRFGQQFAEQEFWELRYFGRDMSEFLKLIKERWDQAET